jgi:hypothetical protein
MKSYNDQTIRNFDISQSHNFSNPKIQDPSIPESPNPSIPESLNLLKNPCKDTEFGIKLIHDFLNVLSFGNA